MENSQFSFPDPYVAPKDAPLAVGGDLSVATLLEAYTHGIFPWYGEGTPILWWSPDPRFILELDAFHVPQSLARRLSEGWEISADQDFRAVMEACAESRRPGQGGTWITRAMLEAYEAFHHAGYAHSIEVRREGKLVGGLYGVALGSAFCGESMFYRQPDASKVALVALVQYLKNRGFAFIDCQQATAHLARFGAKVWPRSEFLDALRVATSVPFIPRPWTERISLSGHEGP